MPLVKLLNDDCAGYFADNADAPDALWLFLHIPKTAGTSFRAELAKRLRPNANICRNEGGSARLPSFPSVQAALDHFLAQQLPAGQVRFASGHLTRSQVDTIAARHPRPRLITMLRDPETRVVSDYRYQRTPKHPGHRQFIERYPTLESYVRSAASQDKMFEFLRRGPDDRAEDVIADLEANFAFVGLTEMYALSRRILFRLLGAVPPPAEEKNRTQALPENAVRELETVLPLIRETNLRDAAIFRHFRQVYRDRREAIRAYLQANPLQAPAKAGRAPRAGRRATQA